MFRRDSENPPALSRLEKTSRVTTRSAKHGFEATERLNEQVNRNAERFPEDFVFQLAEQEVEILRSQFGTSKKGHGGRHYRPYAFTEHGAIMAANVLNSQRAPFPEAPDHGRSDHAIGAPDRVNWAHHNDRLSCVMEGLLRPWRSSQ